MPSAGISFDQSALGLRPRIRLRVAHQQDQERHIMNRLIATGLAMRPSFKAITRRAFIAGAAALTSAPALAQAPGPGCRIGPPPHDKGPRVWMDMDQIE